MVCRSFFFFSSFILYNWFIFIPSLSKPYRENCMSLAWKCIGCYFPFIKREEITINKENAIKISIPYVQLSWRRYCIYSVYLFIHIHSHFHFYFYFHFIHSQPIFFPSYPYILLDRIKATIGCSPIITELHSMDRNLKNLMGPNTYTKKIVLYDWRKYLIDWRYIDIYSRLSPVVFKYQLVFSPSSLFYPSILGSIWSSIWYG